MEQKPSDPEPKASIAVWPIALGSGTAIGEGIGAAIGSLGAGIAIGVGVGVAVGLALYRRFRSDSGDD
jgi:hypothetical protein